MLIDSFMHDNKSAKPSNFSPNLNGKLVSDQVPFRGSLKAGVKNLLGGIIQDGKVFWKGEEVRVDLLSLQGHVVQHVHAWSVGPVEKKTRQ